MGTDDENALELLEEQAEERVRRVWHDGRWWFSIIDLIGLLVGTERPSKYWNDLKARLAGEGFDELSAKIGKLKMPSADGKMRGTEAADEETLLRIIQSVPSPKAEPIKQWLARVGAERIAESEDPGLAVARARKQYARLGYTDEWIDRRLQGMAIREELTAEWVDRGAAEQRQMAVLTSILHSDTFDLSVGEHQQIKGLAPRQNLRDSMSTLELLFSALAEEGAKTLHEVRDSQGMGQLSRDAHEAGDVAGAARRDLEARTGQPVVSPENYRQLRQERQRELQPRLFGGGDGGDADAE
jgi:hypothetical protein